ncbi:unnamed protein product [Nezara viridula]|uniref:beta-N-acetylhexosaminidase n=1 Tax=Nezara viridula TaxID=85310 RepID=A0A9P0HBF8_NEZVI|nr:unnamed protein product [Nezara viridula]
MSLLVLVAVINIFYAHVTTKEIEKEDDRTTYVCFQGNCVAKITLDGLNKSTNSTTFQSMENCRLLCGKYGNLWPLPTLAGELGSELVPVSPKKMYLTKECCGGEVETFMNEVFEIFRDNLVTECGGDPIAPSSVAVNVRYKVSEENLVLNMTTNEEYKLRVSHVPGNNIDVEIVAKTVFGARHALETLSQLTGRRRSPKSICSVYMMTSALIRDKPVFGHRGVLIDTSRHYIPMADLERTIRGMAANKLNVLHWHATDTHSFPLALSKVPALAELGAYSPKEVYTEKDIKYLVDYAKFRGVRILMEIDSPAHAGNGWQFGEQEGLGKLVLCRNSPPWQASCVQPPCGQMNPANDNLYKVLGGVYKNLQDLIPSEDIFHMGGDEVHLGCWNSSDEIINYMRLRKYPRTTEGFMQLWTEFHKKALQTWDAAIGHSNTKVVLWTSDLTRPETITNSLDKDRYIIEAWTSQFDSIPRELIALGYGLIYASTDVWYLDHGFWGNTLYHNWKKVYDYKIPEFPKVLGGEVSLWSEYADSNNMDTRIWPRASALAERLWSSPTTDSSVATYRLLEMRERMIRRGIAVDQIIPQWCYLNEGLC